MEQKFIIRHSIFQLTSSRRGWRILSLISNHHPVFQLTSSRRGWRGVPDWQAHKWGYFNSHPHEEDDVKAWYVISTCPISTHILTKRMTATITFPIPFSDISTHILTKRMTRTAPDLYLSVLVFQLTSSRRGWRKHPAVRNVCIIFQLTSSRRGWQEMIERVTSYGNISTHILTKRMTLRLDSLNFHNYISTHILTKRMTFSCVCK